MNKLHVLLNNLATSWPPIVTQTDTYTVALSGGVDSVVLLHLLVQLRGIHAFTLKAIHINHGISDNANEWELFCTALCQALNVPLYVARHVVLKSGGDSLENIARRVRVKEFSALDTDIIILAHHQNDQVETLLSQVLRGSDIHNLASMQEVSCRSGKIFWRPLLNIMRSDIEEYANDNNLRHINDESNEDKSYLRNFVRHALLPEILRWDSNAIIKLTRVTNQLQDVTLLLDEIAHDDISIISVDATNSTLNVEKFKLLSFRRQINLLNYFIKAQNIALPSQKQLGEFCRQANMSAWDRTPELCLPPKNNLIKSKNQIIITP